MGVIHDAIRESFVSKDLLSIWPFIMSYREMLKLSDQLSDKELIDENQWIVQQYRKYIFSNQDTILGYKDDLQGMYDKVTALRESATEKAADRKHLLYNMLRDQWLLELHQMIMLGIEEVERSE